MNSVMQAQTKFSDIGIDPVEGAEIVELLGIGSHEFDIPQRFRRLQEVLQYFSGRDDMRMVILSVIRGNAGDRLDLMWEWLELAKEKESILEELPSEQFTDAIQRELKSGHLTIKSRQAIQKDLARERKRLKTEEDKRTIEEQREDVAHDHKVSKALADAGSEAERLTLDKADKIHDSLEELGRVITRIDKLQN